MSTESHRLDTADFLINAASSLPSDHYAHKLLKSYYLTKSRKLSQADRQQGNNFFNSENCCQKCSTRWTDGEFSLSIAPIKLKKRKRQKLILEITKGGKVKKGSAMRMLSKRTNNIATTTCKICQNRNKVALWKKSQTETKSKESNPKPVVPNIVVQNEKESKPLPQLSNSLQPSSNKNKSLFPLPKPNQVNQVPNTLITMPKNKKKNKNQNATQSNKLMGVGKKVASNQNKPAMAMKKNSLLQLAAALKAKTKISDPNSKLKQMFHSK